MKKKIHPFFLSPFLTLICQALGLIALETFSLALCIWFLTHRRQLPAYITNNNIPTEERKLLILFLCGSIAVALFLSGLYLLCKRFEGASFLRYLADKLSPLILVAFFPLIFNWRLWDGRDLTFFFIVLLVGLSGQKFLFLSWNSLPLFSFPSKIKNFIHQRNSELFPFLIVILGTIGYGIFFSVHTIIHHQSIRSSSFDLGLENNLVWNLVHGGPLFKSSPLSGPMGTHFGYHATFFAYLLAPFYSLYQKPETLLIIQSVLMGGAALPFFLFARRRVGSRIACLLAICFLLYPPLHGANLYDFHYVIFTPFFICLALFLLETRRDLAASLAILITLSVREDVAPGLCIIGGYLLLSGTRPGAGLIVALVGASYFIFIKFIVMTKVAGSNTFTYMYHGLLPAGENSFAGILKTVIANPGFTITSLLEREKLLYLLHLFTPLILLPLIRPMGLLFVVPGFFFTLLSTGYLPLIQTSFQYTAHWTGYLFIATVIHLQWLGQPAFAGDTSGNLRRKTWLIAILVSTLACSYQYGAFMQRHRIWGGFGPYVFGSTTEDKVRRNALYELIALVPPQAKISATELIVPHVSSRPDAYTLRVGIFDADWILFPIPLDLGAQELSPLAQVLKEGSFGLYASRGPFILLKRGYPTNDNASISRRLGIPSTVEIQP